MALIVAMCDDESTFVGDRQSLAGIDIGFDYENDYHLGGPMSIQSLDYHFDNPIKSSPLL